MNPKKPIELARLQGNPGKRRLDPPTLVAGRIGPDETLRAPAGFTPAQRKAWRDLVEPLRAGGILDFVDLSMLEAAAVAMARAREAGAVVNEAGLLNQTSQGWGAHPAVAIERESWKEFRQLAVQLGIGPSARARLGQGKPAAENLGDELDRTLGAPARLAIVSD